MTHRRIGTPHRHSGSEPAPPSRTIMPIWAGSSGPTRCRSVSTFGRAQVLIGLRNWGLAVQSSSNQPEVEIAPIGSEFVWGDCSVLAICAGTGTAARLVRRVSIRVIRR
jgi:hypothetical protein